MNIKALITALAIVGSSSVAMARPATTVQANAQITASAEWSFGFGAQMPSSTRPQIRDHRTPVRTTVRTPIRVGTFNRDVLDSRYYNAGYDNGYDYRQWLELGTRDAGTTTYFTMPTNEPVRALHLEAESGRPVISSVFVRYHDGSQQEIPVNQYLSRNGITLPLVVKNSPIHQIIFWSPNQSAGTFTASVAK